MKCRFTKDMSLSFLIKHISWSPIAEKLKIYQVTKLQLRFVLKNKDLKSKVGRINLTLNSIYQLI